MKRIILAFVILINIPFGATAHAIDLSAQLIDLDQTAQQFERQNDMRAVFARVYWRVTLEFKNWIEAGRFQGPDTVALMVVEFHRLYKMALADFDKHSPQTNRVWNESFEQHDQYHVKPTVQLLLGLNAHIATDLPYTVAKVLKEGADPLKLESDYFLMNELFKGLMSQLFAILADMNHLFDDDGLDVFPFQKTKQHLVMQRIKAMRRGAYENGLKLAACKGIECTRIQQKIEKSALALSKLFMDFEILFPYKIVQ